MTDAIHLTELYYRKAGLLPEVIWEHGSLMDVFIATPELVLMARMVDSSASDEEVTDIKHSFEQSGHRDAWHLHFIAGDPKSLLLLLPRICRLPMVITQHGKRGDARVRRFSSRQWCRLLRRSIS